MKSCRLTTSILILTYLCLSTNILGQSNDGLDFLDKVDEIKLPPSNTTKPTNGTNTKTTTQPTNPSPVKTTSTKSTKTTATPTKTTKSTPKTVVKPVTKPTPTPSTLTTTTTIPTSNPTPTVSTKKSEINTTKTTQPQTQPETKPSPPENKFVDSLQNTEEGDNSLNLSTENIVWLDEPLELEPDYLPGFEISSKLPDKDPEENSDKQSPSPTIHPLPTLDGNFSIWNSFKEFLSKYQKAFYIFGILFLFAIYRLKSGRNTSSSRKAAPTIRRMRR